MEMSNIININLKKFSRFTLISLLSLIAGIILWIWWGNRFDVWYDIGIYSVTIVLVLAGIFGTLLSLHESKEE